MVNVKLLRRCDASLELSSSGRIWEHKASCGTQASFAFLQLKLPQAGCRSFHLGSGEHERRLKRLYLHQNLRNDVQPEVVMHETIEYLGSRVRKAYDSKNTYLDIHLRLVPVVYRWQVFILGYYLCPWNEHMSRT